MDRNQIRARELLAAEYSDDPTMAALIRRGEFRSEQSRRGVLAIAAALRESEEWRRDAERLDWLEALADNGYAPRILYDDDGRWAFSDSGSQPVAPDGGHVEMVAITSFVEPEKWQSNIRAAIDAARSRRESYPVR